MRRISLRSKANGERKRNGPHRAGSRPSTLQFLLGQRNKQASRLFRRGQPTRDLFRPISFQQRRRSKPKEQNRREYLELTPTTVRVPVIAQTKRCPAVSRRSRAQSEYGRPRSLEQSTTEFGIQNRRVIY